MPKQSVLDLLLPAIGAVTKLAVTAKARASPGESDKDLTGICAALQGFYQQQGMERTKWFLAGLPILLLQDKGISCSESSKRKAPLKLSREELRDFGRMANAVYDPAWYAEETTVYGKVVLRRDTAVLHTPAYCILDVDEARPGTSAILIIRGTQGITDALTDLNAQGVQWAGRNKSYGHVHKGIMASAQNVFKEVHSVLETYQHISVVGHSLGGGAGTYVTLLLQEEGKDARCIAFGSPPTLEQEVAHTVKNIYSVIHRNDMVPRASYESVLGLQDRAVSVINPTKDAARPPERSADGRERELYSAGTVILKVGEELEILGRDDPRRKPHIIVSTTMISDHFSLNYIVDNDDDVEAVANGSGNAIEAEI